jgi:hypothetical protein
LICAYAICSALNENVVTARWRSRRSLTPVAGPVEMSEMRGRHDVAPPPWKWFDQLIPVSDSLNYHHVVLFRSVPADIAGGFRCCGSYFVTIVRMYATMSRI